MLERINVTNKSVVERSNTGLRTMYVLPVDDRAVQRVRQDQRVLLYEQPGKEVEMEVEAQAQFDASHRVWKFYPDYTTERFVPHRKPAHATLLIIYKGEPIGEMRTPRRYASMAVSGPLKPYPAYEQLRPFFQQLFASPNDKTSVASLFRERDALGLMITTLDGRPIYTSWIDIGDASTVMDGDDAYQASFETPDGFYAVFGKYIQDHRGHHIPTHLTLRVGPFVIAICQSAVRAAITNRTTLSFTKRPLLFSR